MPRQAPRSFVIYGATDGKRFRENLRLERQVAQERADDVIRASLELISAAAVLIARAVSPLISAPLEHEPEKREPAFPKNTA